MRLAESAGRATTASDPASQAAPDVDLRDAIQRLALEFPCYGRRRITAELHRRGRAVNHKRVGRLMREDNLLCLRRSASSWSRPTPPTTAGLPEPGAKDGTDGHRSAVGRRYHLYPAGEEFVYLAVVLDAYSRRVIGWALDRHWKTI